MSRISRPSSSWLSPVVRELTHPEKEVPQRTKIDYNASRGRFSIVVAPWEVDKVRSMPNRRYDKKKRAWNAPAIRANIKAIKELFPLECLSDAARKRIEDHDEDRANANLPGSFPAHYPFKRHPRKAQESAMRRAYGLRAAALFMDMRTGKTKVVIDLACAYNMEGKVSHVLLVCPLSLRKNWLREFQKDAPFPVNPYLLRTDDGGRSYERWMAEKADLRWMIVGVESLAAGNAIKYCERFLGSSVNTMMVVDESIKIKTPTSNRAKNAVALGRRAEYRLLLNGTPISNNPLDLYMQYEYLDPEIIGLGDFYSFRARYAVMGGYEDKQIIGYTNIEELMELIAPYTYQVRQSEVIDIPPRTKEIRTVEMSPKQKALYQEMRKTKKISTSADKELITQNVLEVMLRLQEISSGVVSYSYTPEQIEEMHARGIRKPPKFYREAIEPMPPKVKAVLDVVEGVTGSVIIWALFKEEIEAICAALRKEYGDHQVVELHGAVPEHERDVNVNVKFQGRQARFIVGNAATGGMGLTMDAAEMIIYVTNTFNFVDRLQSEERATGEGKAAVAVVDILCEGTVDSHVMAALEAKMDVSEYIRGLIGSGSIPDPSEILGD